MLNQSNFLKPNQFENLSFCFHVFQVRFSEDLGEVYKLLVGFSDDNNEDQNWLLDTVSSLFHVVS